MATVSSGAVQYEWYPGIRLNQRERFLKSEAIILVFRTQYVSACRDN
jgi:hypothetical protein